MKIGILLTDDLRDLLQPRFGCYPDMFKTLLQGNDFTYEVYDVRKNRYPDNLQDCDGYIITGSRHGVNDPLPWLDGLFAYVRRLQAARIKLLGICFGHQAVAYALGGRVEKSNKGWGVGLQQWKVIERAPWMPASLASLSLLASHQDQVTQLPATARLLIGSPFCPYAAFSIDDHIFCLQGHPEFTPDYSRALLEYRHDDMPTADWQQAADSVDSPSDQTLCAEMIAAFFRFSCRH